MSQSSPKPRNPNAAPGPHLALKQAQSLMMTPALRQAISLLQMNNLELDALVAQEIEANPFLERAGDNANAPDDDAPSAREAEYHALHDYQAPDQRQQQEAPKPAEERLEYDTSNVFNSETAQADGYDASGRFDGAGAGGNSSFDDPDYSLENRLSREDSLFDHLTAQIQLEFAAPQDRLIAFSLLEGLDEAGYYRGNLMEVARQLECELSDVELVLARLQQCDPAGIFALNVAQCMELQLRDRGELTPVLSVLLANLSLLEKHDYKTLQKKCGVTDAELKTMLIGLRRLDPKPGARFNHDVVQTLVPDIAMRKSKDPNTADAWIVELNTDTLPRVLVNQRYAALVNSKTVKGDDKTFMVNQYQGAQWLVKAMDQRAQTILKVASEIIRQQEMFFIHGVAYLKPLVLREIAELVEVHESTVSRVTTGKYMTTPRGTFELKYFFSSGLGGNKGGEKAGDANGMSHSSNAIKARIKTLVDQEDPGKILSDDDIVKLLTGEGIPIARRTVTKYREALRIGSSVDRRRQKRLD